MVQSCSKASNISDDTTSNNEYGLISGNTIGFHVNENTLNILDVLVDLISIVNQLHKWNLIGIKIFLKIFAKKLLDLVIDDSDTSSEWCIYFSQDFVRWIQNVSGDLDRGCQVGTHGSLNFL